MRRNMNGNLGLYKYLWPGSVGVYRLPWNLNPFLGRPPLFEYVVIEDWGKGRRLGRDTQGREWSCYFRRCSLKDIGEIGGGEIDGEESGLWISEWEGEELCSKSV